jgi:hypothetical protein
MRMPMHIIRGLCRPWWLATSAFLPGTAALWGYHLLRVAIWRGRHLVESPAGSLQIGLALFGRWASRATRFRSGFRG